MTGRAHRAIAGTGTAAAWALGDLDGAAALLMLTGATMAASGPDRIEKPFRADHREWTHLLLTGLVVGLLTGLAIFFLPRLAATLAAPDRHMPAEVEAMLGLAAFWVGAGVVLGWWLHSLADACTDGGCWLILRRDVHILPDWELRLWPCRYPQRWWQYRLPLRIKVYTIKTKRSWLTGKPKRDRRTGKIKTSKKPSRGERTYGRAAVMATVLIMVLHLVSLGAAPFTAPNHEAATPKEQPHGR